MIVFFLKKQSTWFPYPCNVVLFTPFQESSGLARGVRKQNSSSLDIQYNEKASSKMGCFSWNHADRTNQHITTVPLWKYDISYAWFLDLFELEQARFSGTSLTCTVDKQILSPAAVVYKYCTGFFGKPKSYKYNKLISHKGPYDS